VEWLRADAADVRRKALEEAAEFVEEKHSGTEYGRQLAREILALAARGVGRG
jgi:hypothetical protein